MIYEALALSDAYILDYLEIDEKNREIPLGYDFFAFNYHPTTMSWLNTKHIRKLPGLKLTFVLEVLPNNPFALCPPDDFDIYCVLDPTIQSDNKKVYAFPRPLEPSLVSGTHICQEIPIIGSFGFATPGKGFELLVDAVNKEFKRAIIRINIPHGTFTGDLFWKLQRRSYVEYLGELCSRVAKKGIDVKITHDYMTKTELINWCAQNTLNCFLYNRNQPGLSATTDQAIASGRPLAVSANETFRHIHQYIIPYPFQTLLESIEKSQPKVFQMQDDWAPVNFAHTFERLLAEQKAIAANKKDDKKTIILEKNREPVLPLKMGRGLLSCLVNKSIATSKNPSPFFSASVPFKGIILLVSHKEKKSDTYQYGVDIAEILQRESGYKFYYHECSSEHELNEVIKKFSPNVIIYNYYPSAMPWLTPEVTRSYPVPQLGIIHDVTQEEVDAANNVLFDLYLCPDQNIIKGNPSVIKTRRLIPSYVNMTSLPEIPAIGSFGFDFEGNEFDKLIEMVQLDFDIATINIWILLNDDAGKKDKEFAVAKTKRYQNLVHKPGISLRIRNDSFNKMEILDFFATNTINVFFNNETKSHGFSNIIDYALAVQRPIAINKCGIFNYFFNLSPSICVEDTTLKKIISNGIVPLVPFYNEWSEAAFLFEYKKIFDSIKIHKSET